MECKQREFFECNRKMTAPLSFVEWYAYGIAWNRIFSLNWFYCSLRLVFFSFAFSISFWLMFGKAFIELYMDIAQYFCIYVFNSRTDFPPKVNKYSFYQPYLLDDYGEKRPTITKITAMIATHIIYCKCSQYRARVYFIWGFPLLKLRVRFRSIEKPHTNSSIY